MEAVDGQNDSSLLGEQAAKAMVVGEGDGQQFVVAIQQVGDGACADEQTATDEAKIRQAVLDGYVVRTRADADTVQARSGDTSMREAALRSGAQWVSTDYPVADTRFTSGYAATIPGGSGRPPTTNSRSSPTTAPSATSSGTAC